LKNDKKNISNKGGGGMKELEQKYIDILEQNDWGISSYTDDGRVELETYSPAGENFLMCVEVENFPESVREYANDFDADEHTEMWIEARGRVAGVPNSIRELIEDAEAIKEMLNELADTLVKDENNKENLEELKQYKENSYYDIEDIAEQLIELSNLERSEELKQELEDGLDLLQTMAQKEYNKDCFRVLYNVLLVIAGNEFL
jgi:hypothetical protein